jgi:transglutaminase-like putative cysteine protease
MLVGCDEPPPDTELDLFSDSVTSTTEELDEIVAYMSDNFFMSASVKISDIAVWEQLGAYYTSNPEILVMRGIIGMEIAYREIGGVIEAEIFPQYEMFMNVIIAHETDSTAHLTAEEKKVYDTAKKLVSEHKSATTYATAHALHNHLRDTVVYEHDYAENRSAFTVYGAMIEGRAVCQGYAHAYRTLLHLAGIESIIITGTAGGENHAWNLVNYARGGGEWYHVDVTWNVREDTPSNKYFNLSDAILQSTHKWEREFYPAATSERLNYFRYDGKNATTIAELEAIFGNMHRSGGTVFEILCTWDVKMDELRFLNDYHNAPRVAINPYGRDRLLTVILS